MQEKEKEKKLEKTNRRGRVKKYFRNAGLSVATVFISASAAKAFPTMLVLVSTALAALGVGSLLYSHKTAEILFHNMRLMEAWGIYYGQALANTIRDGGLLYGLAFIMFLWGLYIHMFPSKIDLAMKSMVDYTTTFFAWLAYFGIMFLLIAQPWDSKFNLLRISTSIADKLTDELVILFNGNSSKSASNAVSRQLAKLSVDTIINLDTLSPQLGAEVASFTENCLSNKKSVSKLGILSIASADTDHYFSGLKAYVNGKVIDCAQWKRQLREEIAEQTRANLSQLAKSKYLPVSIVIKKAEEEGKQIFDSQILPLMNDFVTPAGAASIGGVEGSWGPPTENEALVAYSLMNSAVANQVYRKVQYDAAVGSDTTPLQGHHGFWWWFHHWGAGIKYINGWIKYFIGGMFITAVEFISRVMLPYLIQGLYAVNSIFYALVIMFLPLVAVLCMAQIQNITVLIKYIFVMIWIKSWVVPISILMNLYTNYLDVKTNLIAPMLISTLLLMVPSIMAIVLLQGNAIITKLSTGVEEVGSQGLRVFGMIKKGK